MKQCEWITRIPIFVKSLGSFQIDRFEWENENGAFLCDDEIPCRYVADPGEKYCPRHKMEAAMQSEAA